VDQLDRLHEVLIGSWYYREHSVPVITIHDIHAHTKWIRVLLDFKPLIYKGSLFYLRIDIVKGRIISRKLQTYYSAKLGGSFGWWHEKPEGNHLITSRQVIRSAIIGGYGNISSKDKDLLKDILKKL
jgi:hypothetical protein